jgi:hypothetical protein
MMPYSVPPAVTVRQDTLGEALEALQTRVAAQLTADDLTARLPVTLEPRPASPERALLSLCRQTGARLSVKYVFMARSQEDEPTQKETRRPVFTARRVTQLGPGPLSLATVGSRLGLLFEGPKDIPEVKLVVRDRPLATLLDALAKKTGTRWEVHVRLEGGGMGGLPESDALRFDRLQSDLQSLVLLSDDERAEEIESELSRALERPHSWRTHALTAIATRLDGFQQLWLMVPGEHRERIAPLYQCIGESYATALAHAQTSDPSALKPIRDALERLRESLRP